MKLNEFIRDFAENYEVRQLDDITDGIIEIPIKEDIYLVNKSEVHHQ